MPVPSFLSAEQWSQLVGAHGGVKIPNNIPVNKYAIVQFEDGKWVAMQFLPDGRIQMHSWGNTDPTPFESTTPTTPQTPPQPGETFQGSGQPVPPPPPPPPPVPSGQPVPGAPGFIAITDPTTGETQIVRAPQGSTVAGTQPVPHDVVRGPGSGLTPFDPNTGQFGPTLVGPQIPAGGQLPPETGVDVDTFRALTERLAVEADNLAKQLQAELAAGRLDLDTAQFQFDKWWREHVEQPLALAQADLAESQAERSRATLPFDIQRSQAEAGLVDAQRREVERGILPPQQRLIQDAYDTIGHIQNLIESGQMSPTEATSYMQLTMESLQSALRGATPFEEHQERNRLRTLQGQLGRDLLTQRLSAGTDLASALIGASTSLAGRAMAPAGGAPVSINPIGGLEGVLSQIGGGPEVSDLARQLLLAARPGG